MNQTIYIKPGKGMTIPDPETGKPIGPDGAFVPNSSLYRRFIKRGEAEKATPPRAKSTTAKSKE
ncbi:MULTISPECIES: DUF2635 domain-containing protein [Thalassospira]|jgi:hypothetical protein|uniref:DUF2635 domain-containing protein n=1 Tax=Thalassospira TaxID=168934 RepID=UPI000C38EA5C|nr:MULTISPECIES: DUF2635 domain-containing protein [Thalassospira]MAB32231.1 hypothetical protein [Thalassospira sp.]HBS22705.1 hypothetical protein [Thalassospira sp.]|tara:strand:- start:907 stop:1098 length:192 start_codon:yes stop_codon:yes gene_type:complete